MAEMHTADVIQTLNDCSVLIRENCAKLSEHQLNWKPMLNVWSVAQCIDHLIVSNTLYFPTLDAIAAGTHRMNFYMKLPIVPSLFSKLLNSSLRNHKIKTQTSPAWEPSQSHISASIVSD